MRGLFFAVLTVSVLSIAPAIADETSPWQGSYAGVNIGYGWGAGSTGLSFRATDPVLDGFVDAARAAGLYPTSVAPGVDGLFGGAQVGYNWLKSSNLVVGLEADIQGPGMAGTEFERRTPAFFDQDTVTTSESVDWFGTLRGRIGVVANRNWLIYATGGLAAGQTTVHFQTSDVTSGCVVGATICADASSSAIGTGWVAGAGVETMLTSNISLKAEYLYLDLGTQGPTFTSSTAPITFTPTAHFAEQTVRVGLNYHFD